MKYSILLIFILHFSIAYSQEFSVDERAALLNLYGYNVTNCIGLDDRLFQKFKIENLRKNPKTVVLGSSRIRNIDAGILGKNKILNNGLTQGTIKDIISLYYIFRKNSFKPEEIYIGLDPWTVDTIQTNLWKSLEIEYNKMYDIMFDIDSAELLPSGVETKNTKVQIEELYNPSIYKFKSEDFTIDYALDSILYYLSRDLDSRSLVTSEGISLLNRVIELPNFYNTLPIERQSLLNTTGQCLVFETEDYRNKRFNSLKSYQKNNIMKLNRILLELVYGCPGSNYADDFPTLKDYNLLFTILNNGATTFGYEFEHRSLQQIEERISKEKSDFVPDMTNQDLLDIFIECLLSERIKVNFILVPFHPIAYKASGKYYNEREDYYLSFARARGIKVFGSFDPDRIGLISSDFYDAVHVRNRNFKKIFEN